MPRLLLVVLTALSLNARAGLLEPVTVLGSEWLQPTEFVGLAWTDVAGACTSLNGPCSGSLSGRDMGGWYWATVQDMNALFNHYLGDGVLGPGPGSVRVGSSPGEAFFADGWLASSHLLGATSELYGFVADMPDAGAVAVSWPENLSLFISDYVDRGYHPIGAWFYRPRQVPAPGTLSLCLAALLALAGLRRARRRAE